MIHATAREQQQENLMEFPNSREKLQLNKEQLLELALRIGGSHDAGLAALGMTNHAYASDRGTGSRPRNFCIWKLEVFSLVYVNAFGAVILLVLLFFFVCVSELCVCTL